MSRYLLLSALVLGCSFWHSNPMVNVVHATSGYSSWIDRDDQNIGNLLILVNSARKSSSSMSLDPLCWAKDLASIAQNYAQLQAADSDGTAYAQGSSPAQRLASYPGAIELLVQVSGSADPSNALQLLQTNYSGQYKQLLSNAQSHLGAGMAQDADGSDTYYWVIIAAKLEEPCPNGTSVWGRALSSKSSCHANPNCRQWLPSYIAPPRVQSTSNHTITVDSNGNQISHVVENSNSAFLDTFPRIDQSGWDSGNDSALIDFVSDPFSFIQNELETEYNPYQSSAMSYNSDSDSSSDEDSSDEESA